MSKIAVLKAKPESVLEDYSKLMQMAEYQNALPKDNDTLLKLNLSWSLYFPACSTEPWQLEGVVKTMQTDGYKLLPVENETVVTNPRKGAKLNKWDNIFSSYNIPFKPLTEVKWITYKAKGEILALYDIFGEDGHEIPEMFLGKNVVHLPTMKCHGHTVMTGAMKNAFGGLITKKRHHCHKRIHEVLVDLLTIQKEIHPGLFAVLDGTVAGNGPGPRTMEPVQTDYIMAGSDQVAIDAICAKMMGFNPMKIDFIKIAHDKGLGCGDPGQIEVVGENISEVDLKFKTGRSPIIFSDQLFRKGRLSFLEPHMFHGPLFNLCVFGSETYHDKIWYPTIGNDIIKKFSKTEWGKLFQKY
jgi:uncharacterized protein (DUF362 family)